MDITVKELAKEISSPVNRLIEQFGDAGIRKKANDQVTQSEKEALLEYLKKQHGESDASPAKVNLSRKKKSTLNIGKGNDSKSVQVEVRKKRNYDKKGEKSSNKGNSDSTPLKGYDSETYGTDSDLKAGQQDTGSSMKVEEFSKLDDIGELENLNFDELLANIEEEATDSPPFSEEKSNEEKVLNALNWKRGESNLIGDHVETQDALGRKQLSNALVSFIDNDTYAGEMTIGLLGKWGSGKSTLIALLREQLSISESNQWLFAEFNAWEYEHTDNIQAGVAQEAINGLKANLSFWNKLQLLDLFSRIERKWPYRIFLGVLSLLTIFSFILYINPNFFGSPWLGKAGLIATLGVAITLIKNLSLLPFANTFNTYLKLSQFGKELGLIPVMKKHISTLSRIILQGASSLSNKNSWNNESRSDVVLHKIHKSLIENRKNEPWYKRWFKESERRSLGYFLPEKPRRLLYIVDDLDRCSPDGIIKVFEAVRLVMQQPHVTVLVAIDQDVALPALACHYEELSKHHNETTPTAIAREYLGKILQLPIVLNDPSSADSRQFIQDVLFNNVFSLSVDKTEENERKKTNSTADASAEAGVEEKGNSQDVIGFSEHEREHFIKLQRLFSFNNPRQLKRLFNGYSLLLIYSSKNEQIKNFQHQHIVPLLEWMTMIFTIESLYLSQLVSQIESQTFWDSWFKQKTDVQEAFKTNQVNIDLIIEEFKALSSTDVDGDYLFSLYKKSKPFVLPALAKYVSEAVNGE